MDITPVINQLRAYCPQLGGRVGGAADFDKGIEATIQITDANGQFVYPVAVVIPLEDEADRNELLVGNTQQVTESIGVIVEFDASADRRGQAGVSQVEAMRTALFGALLTWNPDPSRAARGLAYAGGELLAFDRARLFWQFRFSLETTITDADGFLPSGDPLTDVQLIGYADSAVTVVDGDAPSIVMPAAPSGAPPAGTADPIVIDIRKE
jgi:hypothetical protein